MFKKVIENGSTHGTCQCIEYFRDFSPKVNILSYLAVSKILSNELPFQQVILGTDLIENEFCQVRKKNQQVKIACQ